MLIYIALFIILCIVYALVLVLVRKKEFLPYRLGDVFWRADKEDTDLEYHMDLYPGTIACEYLKRTSASENWDVLLEILEERRAEVVEGDELVLHIRTGDVICDSAPAYNYGRKDHPDWWNKLAEFIQREHIHKVHIIAGNHRNICIQESKEYLEKSEQFLRAHGVQNIEFHLDNFADDDFLFALTRKYFITTGGGYGNLIGDITQRLGNIFIQLDEDRNHFNPFRY